MFEPSKKQRKLDFKPSQKRKSSSSTSDPSPAARNPAKGLFALKENARTLAQPQSSQDGNPLMQPKPIVEETEEAARSSQALQPGTRKLVVKNLKPAKEHDLEAHYKKTQREIEAATFHIFTDQTPSVPLERLYRDVEDLVRAGRGDKLMKTLEASMKEYLEETAAQCEPLEHVVDQSVLRIVVEKWTKWGEITTKLRSLFGFLDQAYLLHCNPPVRLLEYCIASFKTSMLDNPEIKVHIYPSINDLVDSDRRTLVAMPEEESNRLKQAIQMLSATKLYKAEWEPTFLAASKTYFEECSREPMELDKYISNVTDLINEEVERCTKHGFDSTTRVALQKLAKTALVEKRQKFLLHEVKVGELMRRGDVDTIKNLYNLLEICGIQEKLKGPWESFVKARGNEICADKENTDSLVNAVLEFKVLCDCFLIEAFGNDDVFKKSMRAAFSSFINSRHMKHSWGMGGDKVGELLAKYTDLLLRGGLNAVAEGLVCLPNSTAVEDEAFEAYKAAEFDRQIDMVLELFRYIDGKDTFLAFYKLHLARRLLNGRSAFPAAEKSLIEKLEQESGEDYVKDLVTMIRDMDTSIGENTRYNEEVWKGRGKRLELSVNMLTGSAWPAYPEEKVNLPHVVAKEIERFDDWYGKAHSGRKITWKHALAQAELRAQFPGGKKHLVLSGFQAIVLVLFNDIAATESLSYAQIEKCTGISSNELDRTLASLACGKKQILLKDPPRGGIASTDTFRVNLQFTAKSNRVKIPQVALRDNKVDEVAVVKKVAIDRDFEIQGAIVRVLKRTVRAGMKELIVAVNEELGRNGRGTVVGEDVEKHAKKLIGKDFIDMEGGEYVYLP